MVKIQCPYNRKQENCVKQYKNDLINEETGIIKGYTEGYVVEFKLMDCPKEECGAWHNGKCNYNQGVNM
ncbi:MAG TPA: hypothetical protein VIK78_19790 [Ruminiclostridium sp.]